jgi:hypothetical protein
MYTLLIQEAFHSNIKCFTAVSLLCSASYLHARAAGHSIVELSCQLAASPADLPALSSLRHVGRDAHERLRDHGGSCQEVAGPLHPHVADVLDRAWHVSWCSPRRGRPRLLGRRGAYEEHFPSPDPVHRVPARLLVARARHRRPEGHEEARVARAQVLHLL